MQQATVMTNGASLVVNSGTLDGVTISGTLDVGNTVNGASLTVTNGLVLNGTALVGNPTNSWYGRIDFSGSQSLSGNGTVVFGNQTSNSGWPYYYQYYHNALRLVNVETTLTLGLGITVRGESGEIGYSTRSYGGPQNVGVINQGAISADVSGGTVTVNAEPFTNQGLAQAVNGGTLAINDTWSNSGRLVENNGTVYLGGVTFGNGGTINVTNGTFYLTGTINNTNNVIVLNGTNGSWVLAGGAIQGGNVVTTNGAFLIVSSGTLDGVTISGTLDVGNTVNGASLTVTNGLALNGTALVGNPTNSWYGRIDFSGSQSLSGNGTVVFGNQTSNSGWPYYYQYYHNALRLVNAETTLTLGFGITVRGESGEIGYNTLSYGGPQGVGVINQGTISADVSGGTVTMNAEPFTNQGLAQAVNGGTLAINDTWSNSGRLVENNGTVYLGGVTFGNGGTINVTNGTFYLTGTINNTNNVIMLNGTNGSWVLAGGAIQGGNVVTTNGASLVVSSGTLDGVTISGTLDVGNTVNGAVLTVTNGLALNGTALVGNPTNNWYGRIDFVGTQSLSGNGIVVFGNQTSNSGWPYYYQYYYNALRLVNAETTLTLGLGITVRGENGEIGYSTRSYGGPQNVGVINQGTISADVSGGTVTVNAEPFTNQGLAQAVNGGTLAINDTWSNSGRLVENNGTVYLGGVTFSNGGTINVTNGTFYLTGTINNTNNVIMLNGTNGSWVLAGGVIQGGNVVTTNGASLVVSSGILDGVTISGTLDVGNTVNGASLTVTNGLALNGTALVGNPTNNWYGRIDFVGTQSLSGNGIVVFGNQTSNSGWPYYYQYYYNALRLVNAETTLTLGLGITVRGENGEIGYSTRSYGGPQNVGVINQGTISADVSGGLVAINALLFVNQGSLQSVGGALDLNCPVQIDGDGRLMSHASDLTTFAGNLLGTTRNAAYYDPQGTVQLNGSGTAETPQLFEVMSRDLGNAPASYNDNFAYGTIQLANNTYVKLVDLSHNTTSTNPEALYVSLLIVPAGCTLELNGLKVYARLAQISGTLVGGDISQTPDSGAIAYGASTPGAISLAGELDEWSFTGRGGRSATVVVNPGSTAPAAVAPYLGYAQVVLLDATNGVVAAAANTSFGEVITLTDVPLPMDGVYRVQVRASPEHPASTGNYLITVWDVTANVATLALNRQCNGSMETPYSVDRWTFSAVAGQQVRFNLLNSSGSAIAFDFRGPGNWGGFTNLATSSDLITLSASGTYTLTAHGTGGQYGGAYAFRMDETTVTDVSLGSLAQGQLVGSGQAQLFKVVVGQSSPTMFSLYLGNSTAQVAMYVKYGAPPTRSDYDQRYEGTSAQLKSILVQLATEGNWYVLIYGAWLSY